MKLVIVKKGICQRFSTTKMSCCTLKRLLTTILIIAAILFIISLFLWIGFPILFPILVDQNLILTEGKDGRPTMATFFWIRPPFNAIMNFRFFNVTNADEVVYEGAKPSVQEVGPFAVRYSEAKRDYRFSEDGEEVYYKNYKRYTFIRELSCDYCDEDTLLTLPNGVGVGALASMMNPKFGCDSTCRTLVEIGLLLLGEHPFRTVKFIDVMFNGYNDPFMTFSHSAFYEALCDLFNDGEALMPFPIPTMPLMGYLYGFNDTNDEDYVVKTGKSNIKELGKVVKWAGIHGLPHEWYTTPQARMINGSDCGSLNHPRLTKQDVLPFFLALMCRSFYATYAGETIVKGIPSYKYEVPYESFDSTLNENMGFRYENAEKVNYFKDWDPCPNKKTWNNCSSLPFIDCSKQENFCNECCEGKFVDGTYLLPPGMFPLVCFPGKKEFVPFSVVVSPPHWVYSPPEVANSVRGVSPSRERHIPFVLEHEPFSGMFTRARIRLMTAFPIFRNRHSTLVMNIDDVMVPAMWFDVDALLNDPVYDMLRSMFVVLPQAVLVTKIVTLVVSVVLTAIVIAYHARCVLQRRRITYSPPNLKKANSFNGNVRYL